MVVMEAAAAGTPTRAFDVAGVRDAVVPDRTGTLVTSEDEFVAEWIALAGDVSRRDAMGAAARHRASTFGWSTTVDDFERIADLAIAKRGSGRD
jgi:glycosyltransferase involved in cell wall biosynthesis